MLFVHCTARTLCLPALFACSLRGSRCTLDDELKVFSYDGQQITLTGTIRIRGISGHVVAAPRGHLRRKRNRNASASALLRLHIQYAAAFVPAVRYVLAVCSGALSFSSNALCCTMHTVQQNAGNGKAIVAAPRRTSHDSDSSQGNALTCHFASYKEASRGTSTRGFASGCVPGSWLPDRVLLVPEECPPTNAIGRVIVVSGIPDLTGPHLDL